MSATPLHSALSSTARPPRPGPLRTAITFGWRGMLKIKHVPEQLVDVTLTPVLFLLMFTYLFGGAVAGSTSEYLEFILPGILVDRKSTRLNSSHANISYAVFCLKKKKRNKTLLM